VGSKPGLDSRTRTGRPPLATVAAANRPAAEPPTTITSPLAPSVRGLCSVLGTISLSQVTRTPWAFIHPQTRARTSQEYGLLFCPTRRDTRRKWVSVQPSEYSESTSVGKPGESFLSGKGEHAMILGGTSEEGGRLLSLAFVWSTFEKPHST
jgi:hypothetical protein